MLDIHSHVLPGIDDGAVDEKAAKDLLNAARKAGIDKLVATPHVRSEWEIIRCRPTYEQIRVSSEEKGIKLIQGCELSVRVLVDYNNHPEKLSNYTIGNTNFILLEFPSDSLPIDWEYLICDIKKLGYQLIIAHPERYPYITKDIRIAEELINYGCELQVDAHSLLENRFSANRRTAVTLLDNGLLSYIASDAHKPSDFDFFLKAYLIFGSSWPKDGMINQYL